MLRTFIALSAFVAAEPHGSAAEHLAQAVRIETVSHDDVPASSETFAAFRALLETNYPAVHRVLQREVVNESSLLFTWAGTDPASPGMLLLAHQDVVPVSPGTESSWAHGPFSGDLAEGFIWGRGAWDDKGNLISMMEAVERLVSEGFVPQHTIYLAFGHDEEAGPTAGQHGAKQLAATLASRGVHLAAVLDEGLLVAHDSMKGLDAPVALIGVAEKGYVTLRLQVRAASGHSSMPPTRTAIGTLAKALARLEEHRFDARLSPVVRSMLVTLAPHFSGLNRFAMSNLWLFGPMVLGQLAAKPATDAMVRTTTALTTIHSGDKDNVLPEMAEALVNFRTTQGVTADDVIAHTREAIDDETVLVEATGVSREATRAAQTEAKVYTELKESIEATFPGVVVVPALMMAATDSRYFLDLADNVYRFSPVHAWPNDLTRFHGVDERLSTENLGQMVDFYATLLRRR